MRAYYFDTSALVKRYVAEVGSAWVRNVMVRRLGRVIYASVIAQPEVISALQRKVREDHSSHSLQAEPKLVGATRHVAPI